MKALIVLVALAACQPPILTNTPKPEFWADAPKPRPPAKLHVLAYQPDHVVGLAMHEVTTMRGAAGDATLTSSIKTTLVEGTSPLARDEYIDQMHAEMRSGSTSLTLSADHDSLTTDDGHGHRTSAKRGEAAFAKMANQLDRPRVTITFVANRPRAIDWNPAIWVMPVFKHGAIIPFVELPSEAPAVGAGWTSTSVMTLPNQYGQLVVTYELRYLGDSKCPTAPSRTCAQIALTGRSDETSIIIDGRTATVTAGYEGKLFFDFAAGIPDEVRIHGVVDLDFKGAAIDLDSVQTITPRAARSLRRF